MSEHPLIRIRGLQKSYGELQVLRGIDLDVATNEKIGIIGPSGSGKSTLLRLLMTLERPSAGMIEVDGESVWSRRKDRKDKDAELRAGEAHLRRIRGKIGMVFQHFNLFPHMNVLANITTALRLVRKLSREEAEKRARRLLSMVGLENKSDDYPAKLSGGQKQRVAIARALAMEPKIMLFDEVTSALDPELVDEVLNVLRRLAKETQMTLLIVTHEMNFARDIADRILFFDEGRILEEGPPERIFLDPREDRTREFLRRILES